MSDNIKFVERGSMAIGLQDTEFKSVRYIDIRNYYDSNGEWKPTAKGIMIPFEHSQEVLRVLASLVGGGEHANVSASKRVGTKVSNVTLYLVSRVKPKFDHGVMKIYASRVFKSRSSAVVKVQNLTAKSSKSEPYKVFKYTGSKPTVIKQDVEICVFDDDGSSIRQI